VAEAKGLLDLLFRFGWTACGPQKVAECQMRLDRRRLEPNRMSEGSLRFMRLSALHANGAKVHEDGALVGLDLQRLLYLSDRSCSILERSHRVRPQDQRVNIFGIPRQQRGRTSLRILESAAKQQDLCRFDLSVAIVGQCIGRSNELGESRPQVVHPVVRFSELQPRFAELRIEPHRVGVLDHRKLVALFGGVLVAPLEVTPFLDLRAAAGDRQERERDQKDQASIREIAEDHRSDFLCWLFLEKGQAPPSHLQMSLEPRRITRECAEASSDTQSAALRVRGSTLFAGRAVEVVQSAFRNSVKKS
jgi:hypothetical protein